MRSICLVRDSVGGQSIRRGLKAAGYSLVERMIAPNPDDVLVVWNRTGNSGEQANYFEYHNARVVVCENGWLGRNWLGKTWTSMCLGHHGGAGTWHVGNNARWDELGVRLLPWRDQGERVILGQRGIGETGIAAPLAWAEQAQRRFGGRVRVHPGKTPAKPLEADLEGCGEVLTWNSSAALKALMWGIPVHYEFPKWIGAEAAQPLTNGLLWNKRDDEARLAMFRRLAWAQWTSEEIADGIAFRHLLCEF